MKTSRNPFGIPNSFTFQNAYVRDKQSLEAAFIENDLKIAEVEYECFAMWTWVLCTDGSLWLLDKTHGGGGMFVREKK